jgi:hypothetical protein
MYLMHRHDILGNMVHVMYISVVVLCGILMGTLDLSR